MSGQPSPKFELGQKIKVPTSIYQSGFARIVGIEWGPDHRQKIGPSWIYRIREITETGENRYGGDWLIKSESDLLEWQNIQ